jgi:hypothetical protein
MRMRVRWPAQPAVRAASYCARRVGVIKLQDLMAQTYYYAEKMIALSFLLSLLACLLCTGVEGKLILLSNHACTVLLCTM